MKTIETGDKIIAESDRIVIGGMNNAVFTFKVEETVNTDERNGKINIYAWRNFIMEVSPRIDCGFNQVFNFNTIDPGDLRSLGNALNKLADKIEKIPIPEK